MLDSLPEFGRAAVQQRDEPKPKAIKVAHGSQSTAAQRCATNGGCPAPWPPTLAGSRNGD